MRKEIGSKDSSIDLNMINSNGQRFFFPRKKGFVWHLSDCWNAANSCLIEMIEMWNNVLHSSTKSSDKEKRSPLICQEVCPFFHANLNDNRLKNRSHVFKVTSSYFMDPKLLLISAEHKKNLQFGVAFGFEIPIRNFDIRREKNGEQGTSKIGKLYWLD